MTNFYFLVLALGAGLIIGTFFFGGLWWTVKKGMDSKNPALWFICGLLIRFSVTVLAFYLVGNNHWERMLICLAGFIIARVIITRVTRIPEFKEIK